MSGGAGHYDVVVLGAGPAGQKAAIQAAKAGRRVLVVEREAQPGGECLRRGTIPSKTLRASAALFASLRERGGGALRASIDPGTKLQALMGHLSNVLAMEERLLADQLERNGIEVRRGRGRFVGPHEVEVRGIHGDREVVRGDVVVIATGSRPRQPDEIDIDHEHVLDSDSILSMIYLPQSLVVLGAGVIACEFASIFQALGVQVTMVDKGERPLGFLDPELTGHFVERFEAAGGRFLGGRKPVGARSTGPAEVTVELDDGSTLQSEKCLVALGRVASVSGLGLEAAGIETTKRGYVPVDPRTCESAVHGVYAVGDVIGPPSLAASSMEQGRRALRHALGLPPAADMDTIPIGIYTIPDIASVGLSEAEARERHGDALVGRARFEEVARGAIDGDGHGLLKLVCDPRGREVLGAQIIGEGATELVHLAQLALLGGLDVDAFVDNVFNFPTRAEAYRVAALDVVGRRPASLRATGT